MPKSIMLACLTLVALSFALLTPASAHFGFWGSQATADVTGNESVVINVKEVGFSYNLGPINIFGNGDECTVDNVKEALQRANINTSAPVGRIGDLIAYLATKEGAKVFGATLTNCNTSVDGTLVVLCLDKGFEAPTNNPFVAAACFRTALTGQQYNGISFTPKAGTTEAPEGLVIRAPTPPAGAVTASGSDEGVFDGPSKPAARKAPPVDSSESEF